MLCSASLNTSWAMNQDCPMGFNTKVCENPWGGSSSVWDNILTKMSLKCYKFSPWVVQEHWWGFLHQTWADSLQWWSGAVSSGMWDFRASPWSSRLPASAGLQKTAKIAQHCTTVADWPWHYMIYLVNQKKTKLTYLVAALSNIS